MKQRVDDGRRTFGPVQSPAMDSSQLSYLQNVLGIKSILIPEGVMEAGSLAELISAPQLRVQTRGTFEASRLVAIWGRAAGKSAGSSGEAEILAEKMVSAMKIASAEVFWIDWDEADADLPAATLELLENTAGKPVLVFGERTVEKLIPVKVQLGRWIDYKSSRYLVTLAPETLLNSAEKKKIAWAHLQIIMKEL